MGTWGVQATGFVLPQLVDIQKEINDLLINRLGANVDLSPRGPIGLLSGVFAEREMLIWEALNDDYNSQYPTAFGASLDNVAALNGIVRKAAIASTVAGQKLYGTAGTLVPAGTQFVVNGSQTSIFATNLAVTLVAGANCVQTLSFSAVPTSGTGWTITANGGITTVLAYNANAAAVQAALRVLPFCSGCTVTGNYSIGFTVTFAGAGTGGLMVQSIFVISAVLLASSTPVTVTPLITTPGIDQGVADCTATATGPTVANINTLNIINTPVSGLSSTLNVNDAVLGSVVESDNDFRTRRALELQIAGGGTLNALESKLSDLPGVTTCTVLENVTSVTDGNGLPPKSFAVFITGTASPQLIGNTIFATKPAGIQSYGSIPVNVTDSLGNPYTVYYSPPTQVNIYIALTLTTDSAYPSGGDALVLAALMGFGQALALGEDVIVIPKLISSIAGIPGIDNAVLLIGTAPSPTLSNNITISPTQIAVFDPSRISITP